MRLHRKGGGRGAVAKTKDDFLDFAGLMEIMARFLKQKTRQRRIKIRLFSFGFFRVWGRAATVRPFFLNKHLE